MYITLTYVYVCAHFCNERSFYSHTGLIINIQHFFEVVLSQVYIGMRTERKCGIRKRWERLMQTHYRGEANNIQLCAKCSTNSRMLSNSGMLSVNCRYIKGNLRQCTICLCGVDSLPRGMPNNLQIYPHKRRHRFRFRMLRSRSRSDVNPPLLSVQPYYLKFMLSCDNSRQLGTQHSIAIICHVINAKCVFATV